LKKKSFISKNQTNYNGLKDFYSDVLNAYKPMSAADERHMWKLVKQGNEYARERIINSNLRWVIKEANRYSALSGVQSEDLIGEGFYALVQAAHHYDVERSTKFLSFATYYIRGAFSDLIKKEEKFRKRLTMVDVFSSDEDDCYYNNSIDVAEADSCYDTDCEIHYDECKSIIEEIIAKSYYPEAVEEFFGVIELMQSGYTLREATVKCGLPNKFIKEMIQRVRDHLKTTEYSLSA
jgi:RNA polymerase sigma factor (sigma-70 family)